MLQLAHSGTTVLHMDVSTHQTALVELRLEQCNGTLTWASAGSQEQEGSEISAGLKMK